jgi:DNA invertase Pin-like site-specific DNA recombinase
MVLRDDGRSAWSVRAKRPGWIELVSRLESGASQGVIAWHADRLMRQPRDLEMLIGFGDRGLIVASCHGDYNLSNGDDRFA